MIVLKQLITVIEIYNELLLTSHYLYNELVSFLLFFQLNNTTFIVMSTIFDPFGTDQRLPFELSDISYGFWLLMA